MPRFLSLLLLLLSSLSIPVSLSTPFSTLTISETHNETLVCALVSNAPLLKSSDLTCTTFPGRETITYSGGGYGHGFVQYSALAAADDYLCGIAAPPHGKTSMLWWSFTDEPDEPELLHGKRVYLGPPLQAISAGDSHVCCLTSGSGSLECWRWKELRVPKGINFTAIAVGGEFVCGITSSCNIRCFGKEKDVVGKEPAGNFMILAAGTHHACAVSTDNNLTCWGSGAPKMDLIPDDLMTLSLGTNITCILTGNGTVKCWGRDATPPKEVTGLEFVSIQAKGGSVCGVLMSNYSVFCWGSKNFENNTLVYQHAVLPGTCTPQASCPCGSIPGSANSCSDEGYVICQSCKISLISSSKENQTAPPLYSGNHTSGGSNRIRKILMFVGIGGAVLAASIAVSGFVLYKRARKKENNRFDPTRLNPTVEQPNPETSSSLVPKNGLICKEFTFRALHRATDGFAEGNKVGSGGFGTVYWGVLPDGRQAAVKRAHQRRRRHAENAFLSELAFLSRVNHKNLVGLLGFCDERGERILVVEYMPNGTLYDHLHRLPPSDSSPLFTSWIARLRIALDAARGIEYLHSYAVPGIIHRDIKSSNILLDGDWMAKVSDFGLSMTRTAGSGSGNTSAGTLGYMDPEYYRLQEFTEKSDVYSFGVVLLEIVTGCKAILKMGDEEEPCHVAEYVMPMLSSGDMARLADNRVPMKDVREQAAVESVAKLAAQCVRTRGKARPTMREVVLELEWALGLCGGDEEEMVEVVLEVDGSVSSMSTYDLE